MLKNQNLCVSEFESPKETISVSVSCFIDAPESTAPITSPVAFHEISTFACGRIKNEKFTFDTDLKVFISAYDSGILGIFNILHVAVDLSFLPRT